MLNSPSEQPLLQKKPGRLKKRPEFLYVANKGDKWVSETMVIQAIPTDRKEVRFGFTATKKIGNAVMRNRAKRRLRAAAAEIATIHHLQSADIVFIAREAILDCDWNVLTKNMSWCLKRLDILV